MEADQAAPPTRVWAFSSGQSPDRASTVPDKTIAIRKAPSCRRIFPFGPKVPRAKELRHATCTSRRPRTRPWGEATFARGGHQSVRGKGRGAKWQPGQDLSTPSLETRHQTSTGPGAAGTWGWGIVTHLVRARDPSVWCRRARRPCGHRSPHTVHPAAPPRPGGPSAAVTGSMWPRGGAQTLADQSGGRTRRSTPALRISALPAPTVRRCPLLPRGRRSHRVPPAVHECVR